jgi:hypothetical protein
VDPAAPSNSDIRKNARGPGDPRDAQVCVGQSAIERSSQGPATPSNFATAGSSGTRFRRALR